MSSPQALAKALQRSTGVLFSTAHSVCFRIIKRQQPGTALLALRLKLGCVAIFAGRHLEATKEWGAGDLLAGPFWPLFCAARLVLPCLQPGPLAFCTAAATVVDHFKGKDQD